MGGEDDVSSGGTGEGAGDGWAVTVVEAGGAVRASGTGGAVRVHGAVMDLAIGTAGVPSLS